MSIQTGFLDRRRGGQALAAELARFRDAQPVVVGLLRGGVPVAYEVARALDAPLDVCVVRKIGLPIQPELGIGALAEGGELLLDRERTLALGVSDEAIMHSVAQKTQELADRVQTFRRGEAPVPVSGRTVIVCDDGIATGVTARAALRSLRRRGAAHLVLAAPVGASQTIRELRGEADEIVCPVASESFRAVGLWYVDFEPTTDEEVLDLLARARAERRTGARGRRRAAESVSPEVTRDVAVPRGAAEPLRGRLTVPPGARGLVVFAHGSGSSRFSPRNRLVARTLHEAGLATLLFDLLTEREGLLDARTRALRFDIGLLAERLISATEWARREPETNGLAVGLFGASTGAAAALVAAAALPDVVRAVVSRGGRPDLAGASLSRVRAPTLLLVGGADPEVLALNEQALEQLGSEKRLEVVPSATHLFEEPGALEQVAQAAAQWFTRTLGAPRARDLGAPRRRAPVAAPDH